MKKADLAINTVFVILVTIISIILILGIFSTKLPGFAKGIYCKTFFYIHSAAFIPKGLRADQNYCISENALAPAEIINDPETLNITVLGYVIACWKEMDYGRYSDNFLCFELTAGPRITDPVPISEEEITHILIDEKMCDVLANNDSISDCGDENNIQWNLDAIYPRQNILIEYNAENKEVIVS
ncbi:hypothetical protein JXB41_04130 [Candidatus Woesearchaeota archaeon]|nr:hypothetical protein [Candidatus Woesearchaeota archaeon]